MQCKTNLRFLDIWNKFISTMRLCPQILRLFSFFIMFSCTNILFEVPWYQSNFTTLLRIKMLQFMCFFLFGFDVSTGRSNAWRFISSSTATCFWYNLWYMLRSFFLVLLFLFVLALYFTSHCFMFPITNINSHLLETVSYRFLKDVVYYPPCLHCRRRLGFLSLSQGCSILPPMSSLP